VPSPGGVAGGIGVGCAALTGGGSGLEEEGVDGGKSAGAGWGKISRSLLSYIRRP
jgi:hypothetical protein